MPGANAPYAYDGLDRVLHEKARLGIMTSLISQPKGLAFNDLKALCALTDGNLNRHLKVLAEAGLISVEKDFVNNRPRTLCRVSAAGHQQFLAYLGALERVVKEASAAAKEAAPNISGRRQPSPQ